LSWESETDTEAAAPELVELDAVLLLLPLLLQAAAARHKATDTDATAAPFLATRIIKTTLRLKRKGRIQACVLALASRFADLADYSGLSVLARTIERRKLTWP
jgi:hypothetical protein